MPRSPAPTQLGLFGAVEAVGAASLAPDAEALAHALPPGLRLGTSSGALDFHKVNGSAALVFSSHGEDGTVADIDATRDEKIETIAVSGGMSHSRVWAI